MFAQVENLAADKPDRVDSIAPKPARSAHQGRSVMSRSNLPFGQSCAPRYRQPNRAPMKSPVNSQRTNAIRRKNHQPIDGALPSPRASTSQTNPVDNGLGRWSLRVKMAPRRKLMRGDATAGSFEPGQRE